MGKSCSLVKWPALSHAVHCAYAVMTLLSAISISIVSAHIFESHYYLFSDSTLWLFNIFFLFCFYNSFDPSGLPWDVYFLSFPAGFFIGSYRAFHPRFPHSISFASLCSIYKGNMSEVLQGESQNVEQKSSSEGPVWVLSEETSTLRCFPLLTSGPVFCFRSF